MSSETTSSFNVFIQCVRPCTALVWKAAAGEENSVRHVRERRGYGSVDCVSQWTVFCLAWHQRGGEQRKGEKRPEVALESDRKGEVWCWASKSATEGGGASSASKSGAVSSASKSASSVASRWNEWAQSTAAKELGASAATGLVFLVPGEDGWPAQADGAIDNGNRQCAGQGRRSGLSVANGPEEFDEEYWRNGRSWSSNG